MFFFLLFSILAMITVLILLGSFKGPSGSSRSKSNLDWLFVIGSLFGRGGFKALDKTRIRILMAVWLFGTFILVGLYTSKLFGYLLTNTPEPIVKFAEELAAKPNVDLFVVDHVAINIMISVYVFIVTVEKIKKVMLFFQILSKESDDPLMKKLTQKLNKNSREYRCPNVPDCMERVKRSKRPSVFLHVIRRVLNVVIACEELYEIYLIFERELVRYLM